MMMFLFSWLAFAQYSPTWDDAELMDMLETKIDAMIQVDRNRTIIIANKIVTILPLFNPRSRGYYILESLYDYIDLRVAQTKPDTTIMIEVTSPAVDPSTMQEETTMMEDDTAMMDTSMDDDEADQIINISGKNLEFSMDEIIVQQWDVVTINFESTQGTHDRVVDEFDAATEVVQPGTPTSVTFVADTIGEFEYYCSVGSHREGGMVGNLIVQ